MIRRVFIVCLMLIHWQLCANDKQQFLFGHLNTSHGLSSDNVFAIIQDSFGYIWIATSDGLNKYDGYNFIQYKNIPKDSASLINNMLNSKNSLFIDSKNRLWIGTANGISRYLPESDNFKNYLPDASRINDPGYNNITGICEDSQGTLYFSTAWGLIFSLKSDEDNMKLFYPDRFGSNITDILIEKEQLWIASGDAGLFLIDLKTLELKHFSPASITTSGNNLTINHLFKKDSLLYLATETQGIISFHLPTKKFYKDDFAGLASPLIIKKINDDLWIGAKDGIYIQTRNNSIKKIPTNSINPYGLHSDAKTIHQDNQGNIWIGGTMGGVHLLKNNYGFRRYIPNENSNLNLSTEKVSSLFQDDKGRIWVGYFSGEIDCFAMKDSNRYPNYQKEKIGNPDGQGTIFKFYKDTQGRLWACTSNNGLEIYNPQSNRFYPFPLNAYKNDSKIKTLDIRSICQDPEGKYWIVLHGKGLCKYDIEKNQQVYFFADSGIVDHSISNIYGYDVLYDEHKYIWFSTSYGLNRIDYESHEVKKYYYEGLAAGIGSNYTTSLFLDKYKRLWVATDRGLCLYNREQDTFINIDESAGFKYSDIRGITQDSSGTIWVSTRMNVSRIEHPPDKTYSDPGKIKIEHYEISAFSDYNEFFPGAVLYQYPATLFFGGSKGIFSFDIDKQLNKSIQIPLYITDLQVFNQPLQIEHNGSPGILEKHISLTDTVILPYNKNMLTFEFVGLNFASPGEIEYSYKLEGLENQWNFTTEKSKITYGNLSPQQYTFRIKASVLNQNQEQNSKHLVVIINQPFWQKSWFRLLAVVFIAFALYLLFIIRINILKKQKRKLEEKVISRTAELKNTNDLLTEKNHEVLRQKDEIERIAEELHEADQMKIRFFMNISHEFRTPLTLILGPLENLKESLKNINLNFNQIDLIERNAKRLHRLVNQLLDLRKLETNTMKLKVSESNIKLFVYEIFRYFEHMAQRHSIDYQFTAKDQDYYCYFDNDIVEKVMYNILSNAFKYVNDNGNIILTLDKIQHNQSPLSEKHKQENATSDCIKITIHDNGVGIDEDKIPFIFNRFYIAGEPTGKHHKGTGIGLSLTKELIHLHKGEISVHSKKNIGTTFTIFLPVSKCNFAVNEITTDANEVNLESYHPTNVIPPAPVTDVTANNEEDLLILIVDDNVDIRNYLKDCLKHKFKMIEAENGHTGYQKAKQHMPDLIISDIMMPVADGYDLTHKVKQDITLSHIPVILLTARSGKEDELAGLNTGADDYITKPFNKEVMLARITTLLRNRQLVRDKIKKELLSEYETPSLEDKFLNKVLNVCQDNLQDCDFNVEQLCDKLNISQPQLYRKIKSLTGYSPFEFMRILRLKKAAGMIMHHADNISQIAYSVGFNDPKYFSKCFKSLFGQTPSEFKNSKINITS